MENKISISYKFTSINLEYADLRTRLEETVHKQKRVRQNRRHSVNPNVAMFTKEKSNSE